jgi:hypothetical protein
VCTFHRRAAARGAGAGHRVPAARRSAQAALVRLQADPGIVGKLAGEGDRQRRAIRREAKRHAGRARGHLLKAPMRWQVRCCERLRLMAAIRRLVHHRQPVATEPAVKRNVFHRVTQQPRQPRFRPLVQLLRGKPLGAVELVKRSDDLNGCQTNSSRCARQRVFFMRRCYCFGAPTQVCAKQMPELSKQSSAVQARVINNGQSCIATLDRQVRETLAQVRACSLAVSDWSASAITTRRAYWRTSPHPQS